MSSSKAENGFVLPEFCFVAPAGDETVPACIGDAGAPEVVHWPTEYKNTAIAAAAGN
jgi:hypothetical protein